MLVARTTIIPRKRLVRQNSLLNLSLNADDSLGSVRETDARAAVRAGQDICFGG
jgi:hypothetical protein